MTLSLARIVAEPHPNRRSAIRLQDMLDLDVPLHKIGDVLGLTYDQMHRYYGLIMKRHPRAEAKAYLPTPEDRKNVQMMAAVGITQIDIAKVLKVSVPTLTKHYRDELDVAIILAHTKIGRQIFALATHATDQRVQLDAAKFYAARQMAWSEVGKHEITGADGGAIKTEMSHVVILPSNGRDERDGPIVESDLGPWDGVEDYDGPVEGHDETEPAVELE